MGMGLSEKQLVDIIAAIDKDQDLELSYKELLAAVSPATVGLSYGCCDDSDARPLLDWNRSASRKRRRSMRRPRRPQRSTARVSIRPDPVRFDPACHVEMIRTLALRFDRDRACRLAVVSLTRAAVGGAVQC